MTAVNRLKVVPWVVGVIAVTATLAGANRLLRPGESPGGPAGGDGGKGAKAAPPSPGGGVIVLGNVDTDPPPVPVGPPAVAALATVERVLVPEGHEVKVGDPLVQFDDRVYQAKLAQAKAGLALAESDVKLAEQGRQVQAAQVEAQKAAADAAERGAKVAEDLYAAVRSQFNAVLDAERTDITTGQRLTEAQKEQRRRENPDLRRAEAAAIEAKAKAQGERDKLRLLELNPVDLRVRQAAEKVEQVKAMIREAEVGIDMCLVKAKVAGVAEQVGANPGMTYGPSSRSPLLWLVPAGPRVVRAEVEAEFANRVANAAGKRVTVYDHSNFSLTYDGVVRRVGTSFLPKRSAGEGLTLNPSRVLECLIDVADPSPAGKPPLRVGQPVRVSFP